MPPSAAPDSSAQNESSRTYMLWQENHGNFLLAVVVVIFLIGSLILVVRQFSPPAQEPPSATKSSQSNPITSAAGNQQVNAGTSGAATELPTEAVVEWPTDSSSPANVLMIRVLGAATDEGRVLVAVYGSEETFNQPEAAIRRIDARLEGGVALAGIETAELPAQIAIAAFHDANEDGQLNRNAFGIPTERYGFSNDARGLAGPPRFDQAIVETMSGGEPIGISLR